MKKALPLLSAFVALAAALAWLAPATQGDEKKPFPPFGKIDRIDPAFDKLIAPDAYLENLADGWDWAEGPIWIKAGGYLLNSDIPKNSIIKWKEGEGKSVFLHRAAASAIATCSRNPAATA